MIYITTPTPHISEAAPLYAYLLTISGDMYEGVPQNTFNGSLQLVAKPKSIILTVPLAS